MEYGRSKTMKQTPNCCTALLYLRKVPRKIVEPPSASCWPGCWMLVAGLDWLTSQQCTHMHLQFCMCEYPHSQNLPGSDTARPIPVHVHARGTQTGPSLPNPLFRIRIRGKMGCALTGTTLHLYASKHHKHQAGTSSHLYIENIIYRT